jgi:hypothetical protein
MKRTVPLFVALDRAERIRLACSLIKQGWEQGWDSEEREERRQILSATGLGNPRERFRAPLAHAVRVCPDAQ